jgi:hypothetical protein
MQLPQCSGQLGVVNHVEGFTEVHWNRCMHVALEFASHQAECGRSKDGGEDIGGRAIRAEAMLLVSGGTLYLSESCDVKVFSPTI